MVDRQNIQELFGVLSPQQVVHYLKSRNWELVKEDQSGYFVFETNFQETLHRVRLLNSFSHTKYKSRLQNLVFTLAVLYEEEPLEICNSIFEIHCEPVQEPPKALSDERSRLVLRNGSNKTVKVFCETLWDDALNLEPDDQLEVVFHPHELPPPQVDYLEQSIELRLAKSKHIRAFKVPAQ